jgi:predicted nucleic acid-binding protein
MAWLLDTTILSENRMPRPEPKAVTFVSGSPLDDRHVSAVTLAELRFGMDLLSHGGTQRANLSQWLRHPIRPIFNNRLLPVSEDVLLRWRFLIEIGWKLVRRSRGGTSSDAFASSSTNSLVQAGMDLIIFCDIAGSDHRNLFGSLYF